MADVQVLFICENCREANRHNMTKTSRDITVIQDTFDVMTDAFAHAMKYHHKIKLFVDDESLMVHNVSQGIIY